MSVETLIFNRFVRHKNVGYTRPVVRISTIGVVLSTMVMIFSICISFGFKGEVSRQVFGFSGHLRIGNYQTSTTEVMKPISIDSIDWQEIKNVENLHIQAVASQIGLIKTDLYNHGILLKGVAQNYDFSFFESCLIEGKLPQFTKDNISNDVLISKTLAKKLHLQVGEKLRTYFIHNTGSRARAFNICGIYESGFSTFDEKMMIGDLRHIQKLNDWNPNEVGSFEIILPSSQIKNLEQYAQKMNSFLPLELVAIPITSEFPEIFSWLELMDVNVLVILVIMAIVIAISLISVFVVMIIEKTNEIGIFKTIGMSLATLRHIFVGQVMYIATKGLLIGNFIGLALCFLQRHSPILKLNPETYYIKHVPIQFEWSWLLACNAGTLLIVLLAALLPSIAIGKIREADAVKFN